MIGTLLSGRYEILELVGTGGMANVYKARCTYLNRYVAIKVLKDEFKNDEEFLKRFNIESQAAAGLSHSNVVSVYDIGNENDIHYIVMEYVEGVTLKEYLMQYGALPCEKVVEFSIQIASALQHAHRKGIVHRDIKPQNIIVTKDEILKVTDFGIARAVSTYTMKIEDGAMGTVHYCSPEQARGGYTDEKSDIYSLGVVMYEMLTGKLPFESDNSVSVALKHMQEEAVSPSELVQGVWVGVEEIIKRAMKKNQNDRFQTAGELIVELKIVQMDSENTIVRTEEEFKTKKIDTVAIENELKKHKELEVKEKKVDVKKSKTNTKNNDEDKIAVFAGIAASVVVVAIFAFFAIFLLFPNTVTINKGDRGEIEVPELIGVDLSIAKESYKDIKIKNNDEEYSSEYDEGVIIRQDPDAGTMIKSPYVVNVTVSKGPQVVRMPDVENMDYREAEIKLDEAKILYSIEFKNHDTIPENTVIQTEPASGTKVKVGIDRVIIVVSAGAETTHPTVPSVVGMEQGDAERRLASVNMIANVEYEKSDHASMGKVIKQSVEPGSQAAEKSAITITVGAGPNGELSPDAQEPTTEGDKPSSSGQKTKEVTVILPSDEEKMTVKVTANGNTVYEGTHSGSEGAISVPVSGSGDVVDISYINGRKIAEKTVKF